MKLRLFVIFSLLFLFGSGAYLFDALRARPVIPTPAQVTTPKCQGSVIIEDTTYCVEIADTSEKQTQGLSGHAPLAANEGMLFTFARKSTFSFWMKDMLFPLDFVWINGDTIADLTENAPNPKSPDDELPIYRPKSEVDMVLEISAGEIAKHGFQVGQKVKIDR